MIGITHICIQVVSQNSGMGYSFLYDSAKDCLRWAGLSVKDNIKLVMSIGSLVHLKEETFSEVINENEFLEVSKEDLAKMYQKA